MSNKKSAEELHKPVIKKFEKRKVYSPAIENIWDADLDDVQLINGFDRRTRFLLYAIDIFSKYVCVIPLKDKKGITTINAFQRILKESNRKSQNMVSKGSEFYKRLIFITNHFCRTII